ncbi:unnamed protein product [Blepharisma stoltei]|uniref:DNA 3'-5' helicase n=1 Tax=Blepharisma stoltei TaxID=1481888 RepID=A0AAU9JR24_9CILI|nr:unnamed protein product [Blepharisma stoltei]
MSFIPSTSFFDAPGDIEKPQAIQVKKVIKRPPPTNKLKLLTESKSEPIIPDQKNRAVQFYESSVLKLMQNDDEEVKEPEILQLDMPLIDEEIKDETFNKALNQNFAEIPKKAKEKLKQKPKFKENFVKLNLSKGKSFSKMGKTRYGKKGKNKALFDPTSYGMEQRNIVSYSEGFTNKVRTEHTDWAEILKTEFGFNDWREGQLESIQKLTNGNNVLTILPTGAGKSLIYQFSARILAGLTIVITPLVSLITDQILRLPVCLSGACIHAQLPPQLQFKIYQEAKEGKIDILYLTPEKFLSDCFKFQNISLFCIDEAHCVSQLSFSSRLSYLLIPKSTNSLRILALTATAHKDTCKDISEILHITEVVSYGFPLRKNIEIKISRDPDITTAIGRIIKTDEFRKGSVIIYSPFQYLADSVAQWLKSKGESAASFHGGLPDYKKEKIQENFMTGKIRVLVATVSFGMGIDKANVKGVIHMYLPKTLEHLVQETGRAGRDGEKSYAHIILNERDMFQLRSLGYTNHITKRHIIQLVKAINRNGFKRKRGDNDISSKDPSIIKLQETCEDMGLEKDTLSSLLLELEKRDVITLNPLTYTAVQIRFHKSQPDQLAEKYSIISHVLAKSKNYAGVRKLYIPDITEGIGLSVQDVIQVLRRLAATGEISCEFSEEAFILEPKKVPEDFELLKLAKDVEMYFSQIEEVYREKIETCYNVLNTFAADSYVSSKNCNEELGDYINTYMNGNVKEMLPEQRLPFDIDMDIHSVVGNFDGIPDTKDIVCVMQGINSRRTPSARWKDHHMWGRYTKYPFPLVYEAVDEFILDEIENKIEYRVKRQKEETGEIIEQDN